MLGSYYFKRHQYINHLKVIFDLPGVRKKTQSLYIRKYQCVLIIKRNDQYAQWCVALTTAQNQTCLKTFLN